MAKKIAANKLVKKNIYITNVEKNGRFFTFKISNIETGEVVNTGSEKDQVEAVRVCNRRHLKLEQEAKKAAEAVPAIEETQLVVAEEISEPEAIISPAPPVKKTSKKASKGWSAKRHVDEENDALQCTHCGEILSFSDFYNDKTNNTGKQNHCKGCIKEHGKARRAAAKAALVTTDSEPAETSFEAFVNSENLPAVIQH